MRRICLGIAGSLLAVSLAGCGEPNGRGTHQLTRGRTSPAIEKLREQMSENAKSKSAATKGVEDKSAAKKDKDKDAEKKPAAEPAADKKRNKGAVGGPEARPPLLSASLRRPWGGLQAGEKLDQVAELGLAQLGGHVGGHGRGPSLALFDRVFRHA